MKRPKPIGQVVINGDTWPIYRLPDKEFSRLFGSSNAAVTVQGKGKPSKRDRYMAFSETECDWINCVHEVTHAYFYSQYVGSAGLKTAQMEEVLCEFVAFKIEEILATSNKVFSLISKKPTGK